MENQLMALGLTEHDGKAVVSSRDIARVFERRHTIVMRDIRNIIAQDPDWGMGSILTIS
jgi:phage regulator Rha-like protein